MSVSLQEVLENAGYDIKNNPEDAITLLGWADEFRELEDAADELLNEHEAYTDFIERLEGMGNYTEHPTFEEWRQENGNE